MDRRDFLRTGAAAAGGLALAGPLQALLANGAGATTVESGGALSRIKPGYGEISPKLDGRTGIPLLALPQGFRYWSFDDVGTPMSDGQNVPAGHDGMAVYGTGRFLRVVRNQELQSSGAVTPITAPGVAYDPTTPGGNTTVKFDTRDPLNTKTWASLGGTLRNCAGGPTPWGTWLTCEETTSSGFEAEPKLHGYVFENPSFTNIQNPAVPIKGMGRFSHEAVAVDPRNHHVFLTEDNGISSGFYRYVPKRQGQFLKGGRLQMLKVIGADNYATYTGQTVGERIEVEWVDVADPDPAAGNPTPFQQGAALGGAAFSRGEGAWWSSRDAAVYFNCTDGGNATAGQVWAYRAKQHGTPWIELVYESPSTDALLKPDNITVSPRNGILLCEDTDRVRQTFLKGITPAGELFTFAANNREGVIPGTSTPASWDEFAGAAFDASGTWLFVNIQTPGVTFAITGPWEKGWL